MSPLFQGEQGLPLLITSRKCQSESWQIKTDPLRLMGVGRRYWWAILVGSLCGSQQSTRSLTTDGAAFVAKEKEKRFSLRKRFKFAWRHPKPAALGFRNRLCGSRAVHDWGVAAGYGSHHPKNASYFLRRTRAPQKKALLPAFGTMERHDFRNDRGSPVLLIRR
jgi:hypothetical protein